MTDWALRAIPSDAVSRDAFRLWRQNHEKTARRALPWLPSDCGVLSAVSTSAPALAAIQLAPVVSTRPLQPALRRPRRRRQQPALHRRARRVHSRPAARLLDADAVPRHRCQGPFRRRARPARPRLPSAVREQRHGSSSTTRATRAVAADDGDIVISEYGVSGNPNVASTAETVLLTIEHSSAGNHNGGMIAFGSRRLSVHRRRRRRRRATIRRTTRRTSTRCSARSCASTSTCPIRRRSIRRRPPTHSSAWPGSTRSSRSAGAIRGASASIATPASVGGRRRSGRARRGRHADPERRQLRLARVRGQRLQHRARPRSVAVRSLQLPVPDLRLHALGRPLLDHRRLRLPGHAERAAARHLRLRRLLHRRDLLWNGTAQTVQLDTTMDISSFGEDEQGELYVVNLGGTVSKIVSTTHAHVRHRPDQPEPHCRAAAPAASRSPPAAARLDGGRRRRRGSTSRRAPAAAATVASATASTSTRRRRRARER